MPTDSQLAGRALREHAVVDPGPTAQAMERARLVTAAASGKTSQRTRLAMLAAAALALAAVSAALIWMRLSAAAPATLAFSVGPAAQLGQLGVYYAAPVSHELPLRFSDGSVVAVQPQGGVRVQQTDASRVLLFVETGRARFDVKHGPQTHWDIAAGPYSVRVTGTAFDLAWDPVSRNFELAMRSGSVTVTGPGAETGVTVGDMQRFASRVTAGIDGTKAAPPATSRAARSGPEPIEDQAMAVSPRPAASAKRRAPESWSELAAHGDYASIVREAEEQGLDVSIARASADELRALADAARFTGRAALAERALLAIRTRFPGSKAATGAAFVLGRMLDSAGNTRSAVTWYDRYLAEGGPLAPEALGRRMLALRRIGDPQQSQDAARDYLRRFPDGPYARQARELTAR